jgi:hypothetical protein
MPERAFATRSQCGFCRTVTRKSGGIYLECAGRPAKGKWCKSTAMKE